MSFDANGVICTDINKASFQLLSEEDVKKTAVCRIFSTVIYDGEQAKLGGIHDPRLGPMDSEPRRGDPSCVTCGGRDDCPGHLGYIQLYQPLYHPLFMPTLVRLLKGTCLLCRRLKIDPGLATMYLKKFQMVQMGALQMLEEFEQLSSMSSGGRYEQSSLAERRVEMRRLLADMKVLEEKQRKEGKLLNLEEDISVSSSSIENWRRITRDLYDRCAQSHCTHCGRKFSSVIHKKDLDSNVEIQWNFDADCPVDRNILLKMLDAQEEIERVGDDSIGTVRDARNVANIDDEEIAKDHQTLGRRGRSMGAVNLQAYQIYPIMRDLYNSPDRPLLHFLIPATAKHGARFFFMNVIPVSSNKFRPKAKSLGFGSSADAGAKADEEGGILHPRSAALLEILQENAKIGFALGALRYFDPEAHFAKDEGSLDAAFSMKDKDGVKKAIEDHKGNYSLLHQYCRQTQEKINAYIDSTKTNTRNPPPAIRQWMEKKSGAIRQKMMGKRVNFAARTTIAPDAQINTNEIGIPIPFAMKLSIAEHAVPHNVDLLCKLIMNGSKTYPGCNMIIEPSGRRLDLTRRELTESQKRMQCKLLRNHVQHQMHSAQNSHDLTKPYTVLRHLRDGDVVIMNRQPSLHRASMMAHFVRVLTGQKTFRLHYANCNSYNADFDGDEMNLHCAQDPTARAEAALICNADCNYTVAKSGEPLRGLIQDHVLGGNFLTIRGTFLTRPQYFALVYVGVASFTDKGEKLDLDNGKVVSSEFSAGDPYARALGARNLRIVVEEPTIWKPEPLWTGKQVINSILKTLIDSVAVLEYGRKADGTANQAFLKRYRGINLVSKAKTPGDAWMGRLGTDKEEQIVIIRNSELVQGVFDKAQIGAASYGLVHLCYELFGPRVAGMLLSVFARVFSSYLQIRGFSCSSGDFQMTLEGEKARQRMIARCTAAGTLLQEQFIDSVYQHMHWRENIENASGVQSKYVHVGKALSSALAASKHQAGTLATSYVKERYQQFVKTEQINQFVTVDGLLNKDPQNVRLKNTTVPPHWPADPSKSAESQQNSPWLTEAQRSEFRDQGTAGFGDQLVAEEDLIQSKAGSSKTGLRKATEEHSAVMKAVDCDTSSSWNVSRSLHLIPKQPDWRLGDVKKMYQWMLGQLSKLKAMGASDKDTRQFLLQGFTTVPELAIYFPELAKVVGTRKMWAGERLEDRLVVAAAARLTGTVPPPAPLGRLAPPLPNRRVCLPSGDVIEGDGALRTPKMYHPSWVWTERESALPFESPLRYIMRALSLDRVTRHEAYSASGKRLMMLMPSELTRLRMERLVTDYFAGREELFITMFDKFFQANMGELSSKNNDLVSGDVTLYPFPNNGFSSMVTTGAKGSKVNFAMICGMLSQQSLEGKRVPLMISGKTHPAFGRWDLGARAGGLITDRYLTGLRPPDYFFHCMAGREGLVDTAVKTARSGYLQRCVIKSLEGMIVSYDGSVREGDGSIVQFLYGEDGADVCRMTYLHNLKDLLANPAVVQAKFASEEKLDSDVLKQRLGALETALKSRAKAQTAHREDDYDPHFNTPLTAKFPPLLYPGSVSEWFEQAAETQVAKAVEDQRIREPLVKQGLLRSKDLKHKSYFAKPDGSMTALGRVLRLKYRQALAEPGDAVGCLAAQSMGEPATQMTLNTFHLAGHGAANVTLGIPRLREILQTAGAASTPVLYLPVRGDDQETRSANCQKLLLGFRKIMLTDVINAVGVEANVYAQPFRNGAVGGCSEFETAYARHEPRYGDGLLRKYWGYECTIQFENLEHFCKVVPKYTPQKLVNFTINRVVKELLKTVNKLMAIYSTKASEEMWDSDEDELSLAAEKFIFERNLRTIQDKKKALKETFRAAGIGFGAAAGNDRDGGESAVDLDLLAAGDTGTIYRKGARKLRGDDVEEADDEMGDAEFDTDISNDDSEDDLTDPNGSDGEILDDEEEPAPETTADAEQSAAEQSGAEQTAADEDMEDEVLTEEERKRLRREEKRRLKRMAKLDDIEPDRLEEEALWSEGEGAGFRSKHLPPEASRYLESIKVCRKTWRIVIKWGWPVERCPRRIEFMPSLTRIITKQVLQNTPGVANPHVVTKQDTHTKGVDCEVQCEGSNLEWVSQLSSQCVDHTRIGTNDIRSIFRFYGVEAGRASIIRELASVFGVYGITVDFRHLSLIADAMTHSGEFRAFSRLGMSHHPSPLLQMSFETSIKFLTEGVERGAIDNLRCPSGAIVVGRNTNVGTGLSRPLTRLPAQIRI